MARPRSDEKRNAIIAAAIRVIAAQGLGAPTATIAKEANVSNGSLFTYFETKADLLNQLYVDIKMEIAAVSMSGLPKDADVRDQMFSMWSNWMQWAVSSADKRRALTHLQVSDDITAASRQTTHQAMAGIAALLEKSRAHGAMRDAPLALVVGLMSAMAETTVDFMVKDPANAEQHRVTTFNAMWRMLE